MNKRKILVLVLSLVLVLTCAVAGVLAWLSAKTETVTNTFAPSTIGLTLDEAEYDAESNTLKTNRVQANSSYKMVPGWVLPKDPTVTVTAGSEACWVFLKVEKENYPDTYLDYTIDSGWTELPGETGVYYRKVTSTESAQEFAVLTGDQVTVKSSLTQTELGKLTAATYPKLTFTAYAIQLYTNYNEELPVADAWTEAQKLG